VSARQKAKRRIEILRGYVMDEAGLRKGTLIRGGECVADNATYITRKTGPREDISTIFSSGVDIERPCPDANRTLV
jgi:hypothetical protein